jgi:hypothetical protein
MFSERDRYRNLAWQTVSEFYDHQCVLTGSECGGPRSAVLQCDRDSLPLPGSQLRWKKLTERFLLAVLPEADWLRALQVADNGDELHRLAQINLIHTHHS